MFKITLLDGKSFFCKESESIVEGARRNDLYLDHSCLSGRCSSCKVKVINGETITDSDELPLSDLEKQENFILACIRKPLSDLYLAAEDLSQYGFSSPVTVPAKINSITPLTADIVEIGLRLPPNQKPQFLEGQYLNVIWNGIKRSYSIASAASETAIKLIVKNYPNGQMSAYWFSQAKINDLLRIEIANGTFFLRNHVDKESLVFLATGTGIAPIQAIVNSPQNQARLAKFRNVILLWGMKYQSELFWKPNQDNITFIPVLSREGKTKTYVQDKMADLELDWTSTVVYACGSDAMIQHAESKAIALGVENTNFYSDAFVPSN
ncbi:CDP-4-dehydro-6-deoxyglucose reductase [Cyclobacterium xiamenense]|uniref:CDP-4-dehydro-6-deoxyglucose reductase n=1 Tax=Cyclobacterium xiamenense TaxID=1297121 RepID=A0A1H6ZAJ3_9BACT|nr:FAD-binding oxidoreductase [Cyclobacterium xiamenense]SEJ50593.1 CDP-4-dehydro-6-deoxyglucose reductase [Cyclobacterium xiamenense]